MITVRLFAVMKDRVGRDELKVAAPNGTVADLIMQISREYPALEDILAQGRIAISVNHEFAKPDAPVRDGDEVALMPPFSGGAGGADSGPGVAVGVVEPDTRLDTADPVDEEDRLAGPQRFRRDSCQSAAALLTSTATSPLVGSSSPSWLRRRRDPTGRR